MRCLVFCSGGLFLCRVNDLFSLLIVWIDLSCSCITFFFLLFCFCSGTRDEQETGIEGILTRLEKQRNLSFGISLGGNGSARALSKDGGGDSQIETSSYGGKMVILILS